MINKLSITVPALFLCILTSYFVKNKLFPNECKFTFTTHFVKGTALKNFYSTHQLSLDNSIVAPITCLRYR